MPSRSPTFRRKRSTSGSRHGGGSGSGNDDLTGSGSYGGQPQQLPSPTEVSSFLTPPPKVGKNKLHGAGTAASTATTAASTPPSALSSVSSVPSAAPLTAPTPHAQRRLTSNEFFDTPYERHGSFGVPDSRAAGAGAASVGRISEVDDEAHRHGDDGDDEHDDSDSPLAIHRRSRVLFHEDNEEDMYDRRDAESSDHHHHSSANVGGRRSRSLPRVDFDGSGGGSTASSVPPPPPALPQDSAYAPRTSPTMGGRRRHSPSTGGAGSSRRRSSKQQQPPPPQHQQHLQSQHQPSYDTYAEHSSAPDVTVGTTRLRSSHFKPERRRTSSKHGNSGHSHRSSLSHPSYDSRLGVGGEFGGSTKLPLISADDSQVTMPLTSSSSGERTSSSTESSPERYHHVMGNRPHSLSSVPTYHAEQHQPHNHLDRNLSPPSISSPSKDKLSRQQQFFWTQRYNGASGPLVVGGVASDHPKAGGIASSSSVSVPSRTLSPLNGSGTASSKSSGDSPSLPSSPLSPRLLGYLSSSKVKIRFRTLLSSGLALVCVLFTLLLLANFRSIPSDHPSLGGNEPVFKPVPSRKVGEATSTTTTTATAKTAMSIHEGTSSVDQEEQGVAIPFKDEKKKAGTQPIDDLHNNNIVLRRGAGGLRVARKRPKSGAGQPPAAARKDKNKKAKKRKNKQTFPAVDAGLYSSTNRHPIKNGGYPRTLSVGGDGAEPPPKREVELYPAEFSDNTQFYSVLDSDDERLDKMEMREPYEDGECVPMHDWQTTYHPSCNGVHELDMEHGHDEAEGEDMQLFGTKGFWRNAWKVDLPGEGRTLGTRDTFVLKTLKYEHNFEDNFEEHDRIDAVAMERLTSSPHVINIYGYCGHSVLTEYADGPRLGTLADKSKKVPLKRLEIARDIASGLADVHSIDGKGQASFVHLDINPANVVVVGKTLKLNDFNIGIILKKNKETGEQCGFPAQYPNPQWRSPEEANESNNLTEKVDVFSMGHIFFRLICGHEPWNKLEPGGKPTKEEMTEKVKQGKLPFVPEDIMKTRDPEVQAVRDAMLKCYTIDPQKRPSAGSIANFLDKKLKSLSQATKEEDKTKADSKPRNLKNEKKKNKDLNVQRAKKAANSEEVS